MGASGVAVGEYALFSDDGETGLANLTEGHQQHPLTGGFINRLSAYDVPQ
jgi:hypothetical protein